jgi:hypothetical protein
MNKLLILIVAGLVAALMVFGQTAPRKSPPACYVKGEKWLDLQVLLNEAFKRVSSEDPSYDLTRAEVSTWIDPESTNAFVVVTYSRGFRDKAHIVKFDRSGTLLSVHSGLRRDSEINLK